MAVFAVLFLFWTIAQAESRGKIGRASNGKKEIGAETEMNQGIFGMELHKQNCTTKSENWV